MPHIAHVTLVVRDYGAAIAWFVEKLDFVLVEDSDLGGGKRWVLVAPRGPGGAQLLLAKAVSPQQEARIGEQTGGRVFLFLHTDDFRRDYDALRARGVTFVRPPRTDVYGTVAVFEDLCGNLWDLLEPNRNAPRT